MKNQQKYQSDQLVSAGRKLKSPKRVGKIEQPYYENKKKEKNCIRADFVADVPDFNSKHCCGVYLPKFWLCVHGTF
ncbi:MAG: hypothetical protein D4R64_04490 [Porphyromonadaceae bacterium]|nr:MAG: hypothetical protein D4R64_04490 [Porphyromonadaceae bacterium]